MGTTPTARIIDTPGSTLDVASSFVRRGTNAYRAIANARHADTAYRTGTGWNTDRVAVVGASDTFVVHIPAGDTFASTVRHHIVTAMSATSNRDAVAFLARAYAATFADAYVTMHAPNAMAPGRTNV